MSQDIIWDNIQKIVETKSNEFRVKMDRNVHCMDVGINALKASDPSIMYSEKEKLHRLFRKSFFTSSSLEDAILHCKDTDNIDRSLFVEDPKWGDYIVAPSYGTLRTRTSEALKSSTITSKFTGIDSTTGKTTTNIGHLSLKDSEAATTPLETKLSALLVALQSAPIASGLVSSKIRQLHKHHKVGTKYTFNRPSFDINKLQDIIGTSTVLVTLQTASKNSALAKLEAEIERELRDYLTSPRFHKQILNRKGSNSILEDIQKGLSGILSGNTKRIEGSTHFPKPAAQGNTNLSGRSQVVSSTLPKLRNLQGQFYSLTSLQALINTHLQNVVSANMGNGNDRKILNYRTGRFAASAKVERMSQSRQGMITAFYSYMRNPYATFSEGGAQSFPKSRDPKLLLSKSIREIAATKVGNQLRTISV